MKYNLKKIECMCLGILMVLFFVCVGFGSAINIMRATMHLSFRLNVVVITIFSYGCGLLYLYLFLDKYKKILKKEWNVKK